jgi:glutathione peroxidase-family protein
LSSELNINQLQYLNNYYYKSGLVIIAIHSNEFDKLAKWFSNEEPVGVDLIKHNEIFPMNFIVFKTVNVNGELAHPLFKYLKSKLGEYFGSNIKWNFSKFLVDKNGKPFKRYSPLENPLDLENDIIKLLNRK